MKANKKMDASLYDSLKAFEEIIGYEFKNKNYFVVAMTHSSFSNEHKPAKLKNNERLEFLGDAVLELATSDHIFKNFPDITEGKMSKYRASIVCEPTLAYCARKIFLNKYIFLGKGEELTGGRDRDSIISDAFEALIGAVYLDGGFEAARKFIHKAVLKDIKKHHLFYDSKSILQEEVQSWGEEVEYTLLSSEGPEHNKLFTVRVTCGNRIKAEASGRSKKAAEQEAAYEALKALKAGDIK